MPSDGAGRDEPDLEGAILARGGDLGAVGAGRERHHGGGLPLHGAAPVELELLHRNRRAKIDENDDDESRVR